MPVNFLNSPFLTVTDVTETDHDYHIKACAAYDPVNCPTCKHTGLVGFGRNEQLVKDLPMHGKRVGIYFNTRRYRCKSCGTTFLEKHHEFHPERAMTNRLVKWIGEQSIKRTFASIAEEIGVVEGTIRNIFHDHVEMLEQAVKCETPKWMGIDEIQMIKPRGFITNVQKNTIVDVLVNRNQETFIKFLMGLSDKEKIQYVTMDMWLPYKNAVNSVLPWATIVIDKFHVVEMVNEALDKARKTMRAELTLKQKRGLMHDRFVLLKRESTLSGDERIKLDGWVLSYPLLCEAYRIKESFFGIYEAKTTREAGDAYEQWQKSIPPELTIHFHDLTRAFQNWMPEILNYFEHPVTNAYAECLNGLTRVIDRVGRGYSFEALRAKILFTQSGFNFVGSAANLHDQDAREPQCIPRETLNFGSDMETLIRLIEDGKI